MSTERITVEPAVFVWARDAIGMDEETAARKLNVSQRTLRGRADR